MIHAEKVVLMTKLAAYEQNEGKKHTKIANYFRGDYLTVQVFKAFVSATISYAILVALYVMYDFENFMNEIYQMDLLLFGKGVLKYYLIFAITYCVITYVIYFFRYNKAKKGLKIYLNNLKKLNSLYGKQ